jgi:hydroxyacyl-ACP dehydratase HTD2-like protein with hotdog domain
MTHQAFIGKSERREDTVCPLSARAMAATLNMPPPEDELLPPLWHWALFQEWAPTRALGADGHPQRGEFLPADPALPRRMWAGGRLWFRRPLRVGEMVTRDSVITAVEEKTGSSGRLLFVTVRHTIGGEGGAALIEEQDLVYRSAQGAGAAAEPAAEPIAGAATAGVAVDAVVLFRYSAVTGNGHRIHYDQDYAANLEGYASLVVHGPLQATLLAGFALREQAGGALTEFSFRARRPALLHRCPMTLEAWQDGNRMRLRTLDSGRAVCTTAEARFSS